MKTILIALLCAFIKAGQEAPMPDAGSLPEGVRARSDSNTAITVDTFHRIKAPSKGEYHLFTKWGSFIVGCDVATLMASSSWPMKLCTCWIRSHEMKGLDSTFTEDRKQGALCLPKAPAFSMGKAYSMLDDRDKCHIFVDNVSFDEGKHLSGSLSDKPICHTSHPSGF